MNHHFSRFPLGRPNSNTASANFQDQPNNNIQNVPRPHMQSFPMFSGQNEGTRPPRFSQSLQQPANMHIVMNNTRPQVRPGLGQDHIHPQTQPSTGIGQDYRQPHPQGPHSTGMGQDFRHPQPQAQPSTGMGQDYRHPQSQAQHSTGMGRDYRHQQPQGLPSNSTGVGQCYRQPQPGQFPNYQYQRLPTPVGLNPFVRPESDSCSKSQAPKFSQIQPHSQCQNRNLPMDQHKDINQSHLEMPVNRLSQPSTYSNLSEKNFNLGSTPTCQNESFAHHNQPPLNQHIPSNIQPRTDMRLTQQRFYTPNIHQQPPMSPSSRFQNDQQIELSRDSLKDQPPSQFSNLCQPLKPSNFPLHQHQGLNLDKNDFQRPLGMFPTVSVTHTVQSAERASESLEPSDSLMPDEKWLEQWVKKKRLHPIQKKRRVNSVTISVAQGKFKQLFELMERLEQLLNKAESGSDAGEALGVKTCNMEDIAGEIQKLKEEVTDEVFVKELDRKIQLRRKKRERQKKLCKERYEDRQEELQNREKKHAEIDKWRNEIAQKVLDDKQEKELKASADKMLGEVRRKISDVTKTVDRIGGLHKLRKLRKERAERQGVYTSPSMDQVFDSHMEQLLALASARRITYEAELKTLMVMLEIEHEETLEKEREKSRQQKLQKQKNEKQKYSEMLFGEEEHLDHLDPLLPFRNFYEQADFSFQALLEIRKSWDSFIVPRGTPGASRIPDGWVIPGEATSEIWASALKDT